MGARREACGLARVMTQKGACSAFGLCCQLSAVPLSCLVPHVFCALEPLFLWSIQLRLHLIGLCALAQRGGKVEVGVHIGSPREEDNGAKACGLGPESLEEKSRLFLPWAAAAENK